MSAQKTNDDSFIIKNLAITGLVITAVTIVLIIISNVIAG